MEFRGENMIYIRNIRLKRGLDPLTDLLKFSVPYKIRKIVFRESEEELLNSRIEIEKICIYSLLFYKVDTSVSEDQHSFEYKFLPDFNKDWKDFIIMKGEAEVNRYNESIDFLINNKVLHEVEERYKI